ncbi:MAG: hypothetical protein LBV42_05570 [Methanobrevibacter sp.]|jgi:exonuclease SbcC|nr:hypothetical protein [Methanobrevibacter sp.]
MVVFKEISIECFKKYKHKQKYIFQEGLTGIFGKNESGKSTIGDAIVVSLFGLSSTSYNKSDIITWGEKKSKLQLVFELDKLYRINRTIGNKNTAILEINNNGQWIRIENTIKSSENRIQDILGLDYKSFKNSIFIEQQDLNSLSSLNKQERQDIINRLSRYDEVSKAEKNLKESIKEIESESEILSIQLSSLKDTVSSKNIKFEQSLKLDKEKSKTIHDLNKEKSTLKKTIHEIQIYDKLKEMDIIQDNINSLKIPINEYNGQLKSIEEKELEKRELESKLEALEHVNKDLKIKIEKINEIIQGIKDLDNNMEKYNQKYDSLIAEKRARLDEINEKEKRKSDNVEKIKKLSYLNEDLHINIENIGKLLNEKESIKHENENEIEKLKSLINEKNRKISEIKEKESKKEENNSKLKPLKHITPQLKEQINKISETLSNLNNIKINQIKNNMKNIQKDIKNHEKLKEKDKNSLLKIKDKENKIIKLKLNLKKLEHIDIKLKNNIENIGTLKSKIMECQKILNKNKEDQKLKLKTINNEETLRKGHENYNQYQNLKNKLNSIKTNTEHTNTKINSKKEELNGLEELTHEKMNLSEIENNYNNKIKNANIFIAIGIILLISGIISIVIHFILTTISIIGLLLIYKGLKDKKSFKPKINLIKNNRESIGYLKNLELELKDLKKDKEKHEKDFKKFEKIDIKKMEQNSKEFNDLSNEKNLLNKLKNEENRITSKIKEQEYNLNSYIQSLPIHYQGNDLNNKDSYKKLNELYLSEDKEKSNYGHDLNSLKEEINEKTRIQSKINEALKNEESLKNDLKNQEEALNNEFEKEKTLKLKLEEEYAYLPTLFKKKIKIDDGNLYKELLKLYQNQEKEKEILENEINNLNLEINDKINILDKVDNLNKSKRELEEKFLNNSKNIDLKLNNYFNDLPEHYQEKHTISTENLYKKLNELYLSEDKEKNIILTEIKEIDKEISKKYNIEEEKKDIIKMKENKEKQSNLEKNSLNEQLKKIYYMLHKHYQNLGIYDNDLVKNLQNIYQLEDKNKNNILINIKNLKEEIIKKKGIKNKLNKLKQEEKKYNTDLFEQEKILADLTNQKNLQYDPNIHEKLKTDKNMTDEKIKDTEKEVSKLEGQITNLNEDTTDFQAKKNELKKLEKKVNERAYDKETYEIAKKEISLTAKILREQTMDRTKKNMGKFLSMITDNKYKRVKISEDFNITVEAPEKMGFETIKSLSGGTKDQILFAFRLAFTQAIIGGGTGNRRFALFLDEFLGSFDQNRRLKTLNMLTNLKNEFKQIVLISHIEGMDEDVDNLIRT